MRKSVEEFFNRYCYTAEEWKNINIKTDWLIPNDILADELTIVYAKKTMKNHFLNFFFSFVVKDRQDKFFFFVDLVNSARSIIENGLVDFTTNNSNFKHLVKSKMWGKEDEIFNSFLNSNEKNLSHSVFVINKMDIDFKTNKQTQIDRLVKLRDLGSTVILVVDHSELDLNSLDHLPDLKILEASEFF